jgi:hypothetical protein
VSFLGGLSTPLPSYPQATQRISDKQWDDWLWIWKDSDKIGHMPLWAFMKLLDSGPDPQKLEFREALDQLQNTFYRKQEELVAEQYPREIREILMKYWVRSLNRFVGEFRQNTANEVIRQLSAGELAMVQESQAALQAREISQSDLQCIETAEQQEDDQTGGLRTQELDTQQVVQNILLLGQMEGIEVVDLT